MIGGGKSPFFEPGVDDLLQTHLTNGRLSRHPMWRRPSVPLMWYSSVWALPSVKTAEQTFRKSKPSLDSSEGICMTTS